MRRLNSQFKTRFISESGTDSQNSTYYGYVEMDQYFCLAVAEGYDGEGGKDSAKLAVDTAIEAFVQKPGMSPGRLRMCLKKANKSLTEQSIRVRLKAGILLLVSDYTRIRYAVCGNVMLFALRSTMIYHQSATHTVYQSMLDEKPGQPEPGNPEEETRNLYHYLGGDGRCTVSGRIRLSDGDVILAATESFWSRVSKVEVLDAFESIQSEEEFLEDLQELYLRGGTDYVPSCCLGAVEIVKAYKENTKRKKKIGFWILVIALIAAAAGIGTTIYRKVSRQKQNEIRNTIEAYEDTGDRQMEALSCTLAEQEYEKALEAGKKLKKNEERLEKERILSEKISIGSVLEDARKAFDARDYSQARTGYKKALELTKGYPELSALHTYIDQRLSQISSRMEIDNYMQSAALKEAEGDLKAAEVLYDQAEAMLRIVDDPELLQQAQLAKLRIKGQSEQAGKEERAKERDQVIIDADSTAAMDAVLAEDYETAIELYTKIRDAYISLEENEKAEETTEIITSLQKRVRTSGESKNAAIEEKKKEALNAVLDGDTEKAAGLYAEIQELYFEMGEQEKADSIQTLINSLNDQGIGEQDGTGEKNGTGETAEAGGQNKTSPEAQSSLGPAYAKQKTEKEPSEPGPGETALAAGQVTSALQEQALRATADKELSRAILLYQQLNQIYKDNGDTVMAGQMETVIAHLTKMMQEGQTDG